MRPFHIQGAGPSGRPGRSIARARYISAPLPLYTLYHIAHKMSRGILKIKKFLFFLNFY